MFDSLKWKIQKWFALRRAKRLEAEHVPSKDEIASEDEAFKDEAKELTAYLEPSSQAKTRTRMRSKKEGSSRTSKRSKR